MMIDGVVIGFDWMFYMFVVEVFGCKVVQFVFG